MNMTSILHHFWSINKFLKVRVRTKTDLKARFMVHSAVPTKTTEPTVSVEKDDQITLIGICREEFRNSIDLVTSQTIVEAINRFELDTDSPVAVLYGVGGSFSAGHDVIELEQQFEQKKVNYLFNPEGSIAPTRRHLKKPVICAINGFCVASGFELALLCDLRVMEDTAVIGFFNRKLGVPICDGGTVRLSKLIGYSRALDMITTGRRVSAKEAFEIGLINRIVATGTSLGQAVNLAFSICKFTQNGLLHDRASIYSNVYEGKTFGESVQNEMLFTDEVIKELKIGIHKFINSETKGAKVDSFNIKEKTVPDWELEEIRREREYEKSKLKS